MTTISGFPSLPQTRALPFAATANTPENAPAEGPQDFSALSNIGSTILAALGKADAPGVDPLDGAKQIPGFFNVFQKDEKVWIALKPEQLKKPFFFSCNVSKSMGEKGLTGSEMGFSQLAEFRRSGNQIQLVAKNTDYFAQPGTPQERFVAEDYSDSLIASAPVVKRPNGDILVEANALLFQDIPAYQARLQRAYSTNFNLDVKNTSFAQVDNTDIETSFGVQAHYEAPVAALATNNLPSTLPNPRSLLAEFRYNFLQLPEQPMTPRPADDRIGHFVTTRKDYTGDDTDGKVRLVNRWRLEKKDPNAPLSEPVKPITYWIANDVPEKYRESVKQGILEWNKAFERIGFKDAIVARQQTENDNFDTLDARHASVRWYTAADVGAAVGPSHVDPRTGEILDADIRMADVFGRSAQNFIKENPPHTHSHEEHGHICSYLHHAGAEQQFAQSLLEARGHEGAGEKLAQAYIKDVVMHEVGHTLGLRHNFKGSTVFTPEQLQDAEFTKQNGMGSSVMDYHPFNLASPGEKQGEYVMSTLGAYDYLAIQYAYQPIEPGREKETLESIAAQTTSNPALAYESDEAADASDPTVNRFDLGSDPLQFARKQAQLGHELWERAQNRELPAGAPYQELTKAFSSGLNKVAGAARFMTRYIGGVHLHRDHAGTERATHEPVAADKQREALQAVTGLLFRPDSFKFKPEFVARLAKDRFDTWGDQNVYVGKSVLATQSRALSSLLSNEIAQRIVSNPEKLSEGSPVFKLSELYDGVQSAIWSEVASKSEISQARRDLQKEYIKLATPIVGADSKAPGEAVSMMRYQLRQLKRQVDEALQAPLSLETRAHLDHCSELLGEALERKS